MKSEFLARASAIKRDGIDSLIGWLLNGTDFLVAPASTKYHGSHESGLVEHSLTVDSNLDRICLAFGLDVPEETRRIVALFHDICKVDFYQKVIKSKKKGTKANGKINWVDEAGYEIDDKMPLGHGEKSVILLQRFIRPTLEEVMAVRWHMGLADTDYSTRQALNGAMSKYPLVCALHMADLAANYFDGK